MKSLLFGLVIIFPFTSSVMAKAEYSINFYNPNKYYDVTIQKPLPYAPNSECMDTWAEPKEAETLKADGGRINVIIKDSNALGKCLGNPKYNTWVINAHPTKGNENILRAKTGTVQFYHSVQFIPGKHHVWTTNIKTSCDVIVGSATCGNKTSNCLNSYVEQDSDGNNINIDFIKTDINTCTDRIADAYLINNPVVGLAPTWGGSNLNELILGPVKSGETGMSSGNFSFPYDLTTDIGKKVFKLASLAYNTSSTLQTKCDGNGGYKNITVTY